MPLFTVIGHLEETRQRYATVKRAASGDEAEAAAIRSARCENFTLVVSGVARGRVQLVDTATMV